jgi:hypothetical protein
MPAEKKELSPEDMQRLLTMYLTGEPLTAIANVFHLSIGQATRLCREAATTIGAAEAIARLNRGTQDEVN